MSGRNEKRMDIAQYSVDDQTNSHIVSRVYEAALMGDPEAQLKLAELYAEGSHGMKQDMEKARYWLTQAAAAYGERVKEAADGYERLRAEVEHAFENSGNCTP